MLDNFLGNVFGRSKKTTNASSAATAANTTDEFVVLPTQHSADPSLVTADNHQSLYPQMGTMLTQEMIVNSNGSQMGGHHSSVAATTVQRTCAQTYSTPIDNIPFTTLMAGGGASQDWLMADNQRAFVKSVETIDRIQQFISTASQSEYSFHLENNILSESLLQS